MTTQHGVGTSERNESVDGYSEWMLATSELGMRRPSTALVLLTSQIPMARTVRHGQQPIHRGQLPRPRIAIPWTLSTASSYVSPPSSSFQPTHSSSPSTMHHAPCDLSSSRLCARLHRLLCRCSGPREIPLKPPSLGLSKVSGILIVTALGVPFHYCAAWFRNALSQSEMG